MICDRLFALKRGSVLLEHDKTKPHKRKKTNKQEVRLYDWG